MKLKLTWLMTLFMAFTMQFSYAQGKTVTGTVTAPDGLPLPGVNVIVKGTTNRGVQTDFDGKYSISVSQGEVLVFSSVGMKTTEVIIGASNTYNVALADDNILQEVVVIGYGTTTKESFTGTAAKINVENIEAKTVSNVSQALRGEVAGVNVITTSGQPGRDATIRIRGFGSVNGNRDPLYVVDGVPYSSDISAINPADIEGMTILKDAAATSVYGSRGANGVILITTKQGKSGTSLVSVDFRTSINEIFLPTYDVIKSPEEYIELSWESYRNRGVFEGVGNPDAYASGNLFGGTDGINAHYNIWNVPGAQLINPATGKFNQGISRRYTPENWADYAFRTGYRQEANIQFSGGNDKTRYASSFGFVDDEGYGINSDYRRYSTRLNLEHKPKDWLKVGGNIAYSGSRYTQNGQSSDTGSIFLMANNAPPIYSIFMRDEDGNRVVNPNTGHYFYDFGPTYGRRFSPLTNGIADAIYNLDRDDAHTLMGNFSFDINITKDLTFEARYGAQYENWDIIRMDNVEQISGNPGNPKGYLGKTVSTTTNQNFLQLLRYSKTFGDHSLEVFAAHETTEWRGKYFSAAKQNAIIFGATDLSLYTEVIGKPTSYSQGTTLESYFGQLNYNLSQKYFLTGSVRRDGSSRFINDKWGTFWSVGAGWVVSREDFLASSSTIDFLKLKASYGVIGDQGTRLRYGWQISSIGGTDEYSFTPSSELANPDLTWETSKIAQVGFESTWFNNTLDLNVDYYVKNTDNLFFNQSLPPSSGFVSTFINDGQLRNSGLEFDVAAHIFKANTRDDFRLSLAVNGEVLTNKVTEMPIDRLTGEKKIIDGALSEGHSIYDFYMREWAGVDPANGMGLWNLYYNDVNNNGIYDAADEHIANMVLYLHENPDANVQKTTTNIYANATQKYVGKSAIPKVRGAFRINAAYKGFDLTAQFGYSIGGHAYDNYYVWLMDSASLIGSDNWHTDIRNRWQQPGDVTNVPRMTNNLAADVNNNATSTRFLTKADYLSLNNVRLGYTLPDQFIKGIGISKLNIYVAGDNLMFLSARDGFNPSTAESGASNIYRYNPLSTFSLGAKVEF